MAQVCPWVQLKSGKKSILLIVLISHRKHFCLQIGQTSQFFALYTKTSLFENALDSDPKL